MKLDLKTWMGNIEDSRNLLSIDIPGTHDCVTQYVQFSHISKCQDLSINGQLELGIRALDIRVKRKGNRLGMVHGVAKAHNNPSRFSNQMDLGDVLLRCYRFLENYPSECIIIQFKNDNGKENERCFDNLFNTYIKGNEDRWFLENRVPELGEVRGKIVLIRRCKMDTENEKYTDENTGLDFSEWVEQDTAVPEPLVLETHSKDDAVFVVQDRFKYKPEPRWHECVEPFLDSMEPFNGEYVICYLSTAGGRMGPENNARYINPKFMEYELDKSKYYGTVYLDFPYDDLTRKIISNNFG